MKIKKISLLINRKIIQIKYSFFMIKIKSLLYKTITIYLKNQNKFNLIFRSYLEARDLDLLVKVIETGPFLSDLNLCMASLWVSPLIGWSLTFRISSPVNRSDAICPINGLSMIFLITIHYSIDWTSVSTVCLYII